MAQTQSKQGKHAARRLEFHRKSQVIIGTCGHPVRRALLVPVTGRKRLVWYCFTGCGIVGKKGVTERDEKGEGDVGHQNDHG